MPLPVPPVIDETMKTRGAAAEGQARRLRPMAASPCRIDGRPDGPADPFRDAIQVVDQRQASQRAKALRLQRAGNVVDPAAAQPLRWLLDSRR